MLRMLLNILQCTDSCNKNIRLHINIVLRLRDLPYSQGWHDYLYTNATFSARTTKGSNRKSGWIVLTNSLPHCLDLAPSPTPKWVHKDAFRLYSNKSQKHLQKINSCHTGQRTATLLSKFTAVWFSVSQSKGWASHIFSSPG